ncbi:efflux RND transporter permease subunit [Coraliomargarita sp. SDUM461004]|uniref:Efflux RND transporter permease subunit n=1 Tax=Thalassobacterium sedimentorum TaxID=3041258 RepID=A0ABU1AQ63_9BACT|nr:efflux RND transporter permease subunit [Coraliomargarita sp. SDUM461004]MDQ8196000.1 efflux RND transporter permease subunit [Coraliomargarita sp. SDUM461004]
MNLPRHSVRRPIFTTMVALILIVLGAVSLSRIQIDLLPSIELPTASVRTEYEGASPEVIERLITQIIEEIVATVPGVEEITSTSEEGRSNVEVNFVWGTDLDAAAIDLRATIEDEISELPDDIVRPRISKFSVNSFPVVLVGVSSPLDPVELTQLIEDRIRHRFTQIPGVAQVDFWGGFPREVRVELYPEKINALGLSLNEILSALRDANIDLPAGQIEDGRYEVTLRAPAQFESIDQLRQTVLTVRDGAAVTVADIADVRDTYEKLTRLIRVNGERGVRIAIRKQSAANTVEVSRHILEEIDRINREFPQINVVPVINQGNFIERSIENVARSVLYGGGLAVLILLFFLRNIRSTLVIAVSIPISIIATFSLIYFGGLTINLMTLGGLALGVGMMVDSSIVVLENIFRQRDEETKNRVDAAAEGAWEVAPAIVASTITTLVIFLPIVFVQGVSGLLFRELAYVICFSLVCSLLLSLSLVPMLASRLLKPADHGGHIPSWLTRLKHQATQAFERMNQLYLNLLEAALCHRVRVILSMLILLGLSLCILPYLGTEFLPPSDEGEVRVTGEMEVGTRLELLDQQTRWLESLVYPLVPEAVSTVATVRENTGEIRMSLLPAAQRSRSNVEIAEALRLAIEGQVPGMEIRTRAPQGQFLLERIIGGSEGVTVEIRGFELATLEALSAKVAERIQGIDGITDIDRSYDSGTPQQEILIDRQKVADLGFTPREITEVIETAIAGSRAGNYRSEGNSYRILVQLKDAESRSLDEVLNLTLRSADGDMIVLRNLVRTKSSRAPLEITRKHQQRQVTVSANVAGRDLGSVANDIQAVLEGIPRPDNYELNISGNFEEQQEAFRELFVALLISLLLVYMVLACQYESLRDPLVVMLSTPMAAIGVLLTLWLTDTTLNLQSGIGCIMLGGIVVNNAILLVDQASSLVRESGYSLHAAVVEAGRRRFRPILMTTLTTILGLLPLALGIGEGADAQAPLARAVVGGLIGSTCITLILIPVVYTLVHSDNEETKQS